MVEEQLLIDGRVSGITFRNEDNGWTVFDIETETELITAVGILPPVFEGEEVKITGEWTTHPQYGRQFLVKAAEQKLPTNTESILRYLSSGVLKGVKEVTASRIVEKFGDKSLEVIENHPEMLAEIRGISPKKAEDISMQYKQMFGLRTVLLRLSEYNLTMTESVNIYNKWGQNSDNIIRQNPYLLSDERLGIGFERADFIAEQLGFMSDNPARVYSGVLHVLRHNFGLGHSCLPIDKLIKVSAEMLGLDRAYVEKTAFDKTDDDKMVRVKIGEDIMVFLSYSYYAEKYIAEKIFRLSAGVSPLGEDIRQEIREIEKKNGIRFAASQLEAIETAINKGMLILTGGPGTGKTTTINGIIEIFELYNIKYELAAPTGRAAKRISELTNREAKTLHRLLEVSHPDEYNNSKFGRNEYNKLECKALIIDEMSMVDILMFEAVLRALDYGCRLILVGDPDQLPPIGAGNVLGDLIASGSIPVIRLNEIFRQAAESLIVTNAHRIVKGELPILDNNQNDFFLLSVNSSEAKVVDKIIELSTERIPNAFGFSRLTDIQILSPGRVGRLGTDELNIYLQSRLNPRAKDKKEITHGKRVFRVGDKVMQNKNNYDLFWTRQNNEKGSGIFNGDIGFIKQIDKACEYLIIDFDDRIVEYPAELLGELEHAYAITVHKSQGSEFEAVIIPVFSVPAKLAYRNLLYTGVTRAKKLLILVGKKDVIVGMVNNNRRSIRYTGLKYFLNE